MSQRTDGDPLVQSKQGGVAAVITEAEDFFSRDPVKGVDVSAGVVHVGTGGPDHSAAKGRKHVLQQDLYARAFCGRDQSGIPADVKLPLKIRVQPVLITQEGGMDDQIRALQVLAGIKAHFKGTQKKSVHRLIRTCPCGEGGMRLPETDAVPDARVADRFDDITDKLLKRQGKDALRGSASDLAARKTAVQAQVHAVKPGPADQPHAFVRAKSFEYAACLYADPSFHRGIPPC